VLGWLSCPWLGRRQGALIGGGPTLPDSQRQRNEEGGVRGLPSRGAAPVSACQWRRGPDGAAPSSLLLAPPGRGSAFAALCRRGVSQWNVGRALAVRDRTRRTTQTDFGLYKHVSFLPLTHIILAAPLLTHDCSHAPAASSRQ
jgi:hypothetical protein